MNNQEKNLDWIQVLRGIAALLVVLVHARYALLNTDSFPLAQQLFVPGAMGVDLFFLISGFIMCYSTAGSDGSVGAVARFAIKRFARVWPVYVAVTLVAIFVLNGGIDPFIVCEDADVETVGFGGIAGRDSDSLRRGHTADRGDIADVAQHAAGDHAGATGRVGAERQPRELVL